MSTQKLHIHIMFRKSLPALLLFLHLVTSAGAQSSGSVGLFPTIDHSGTLSSKWAYSLYYFAGADLYHSRTADGNRPKAVVSALYAEHAIHYQLRPSFALTGSYVYERQQPFGDRYRNEHRYYVQGTYMHQSGTTTFKHRLRYDGRFIQNRISDTWPYTSRVRYLFGVKVPIGASAAYFSAYNEVFFNTFKNANVVYAENWAAAAIGVKTGKNSSIEMGPLYIYWVNNQQYDLTNFVYLQVAWVSHVNFSKRK